MLARYGIKYFKECPGRRGGKREEESKRFHERDIIGFQMLDKIQVTVPMDQYTGHHVLNSEVRESSGRCCALAKT